MMTSKMQLRMIRCGGSSPHSPWVSNEDIRKEELYKLIDKLLFLREFERDLIESSFSRDDLVAVWTFRESPRAVLTASQQHLLHDLDYLHKKYADLFELEHQIYQLNRDDGTEQAWLDDSFDLGVQIVDFLSPPSDSVL